MQPTQTKTDVDPAQASKSATAQPPAMLEEDDEFEDFPVEGMQKAQDGLRERRQSNLVQIGRRRTLRFLAGRHIFGKKAGMTTTRARISASS